jgi:hypothetical protein
MEMNTAYFEATLKFLETKGYVLKQQLDEYVEEQGVVFSRVRVDCHFADDCRFIFEMLLYAQGHEDFFLEILKIGRMRSFSFPLDSWKYHPNRIEFKFRDDPATGLGLALTLDLT